MPEYELTTVDDTPYLYVERSCSMDPADVGNNMGIVFGTVAELIGTHDIASMGNALSVYYTYDETTMTFRAGFLVSADDASKAEGEVKADVLPAGKVLNFIHRGPYAKLRVSHGEMMKYIEDKGLAVGAPTWEVYLNDPGTVASEDDLETDIYVTLGAA